MRKGWIRNDSSNTVIVFLHGLMSDSEKCWLDKKSKTFWPELVARDPRFNGIDIYLASFYTSVDSNDYAIQHCADEVLSALRETDIHLNKSVLTRKRIIFLGHSTGGIVARYILESNSDLFVDKEIGLALYASPSLGSKMATALRVFIKLTNHKLGKELCWGSDLLEDLDGRFKDLLQKKKLNIKGIECFENKSPFHIPILNPTSNRIVNRESAARYFGRPKLIANSDHSSIVKPIDFDSESHKALWSFVEENGFSCNKKKLSILQEPIVCTPNKDVLFEQYTCENECFYILRDIDTTVAQKLSTNSLWICGPSGVGKTALIQRHIDFNGIKSKYISLGPSIGEEIEGMLIDIAYELDEEIEIEDNPRISQIIKYIEISVRNMSRDEDFILFIEEIPISDLDMFKKFSIYIYTLLIALRDVANFKLVLSSIFEPADYKGTEYEKVSERFDIVPFQKWNEDEISKLIELIEENMDLNIDDKSKDENFDGSPRNVKIFYRNVEA
ncbi:hypothetical protein V8N70_003158 [Vibrio parahaemolyticus]|uniref:alpha/beta hydrolase n=1 Tax=Vibrio parahaemolyticus TaxID=670 RepID=UPI001E46F37A|nr:hypothetical protein [Vibrio parahaemolyticus]EJK2182164.1 hypothetical protein [Vibrio parahaemolyticus]MDF4983768.1 hypothetical protein [Vibrio parahaemolyticus]